MLRGAGYTLAGMTWWSWLGWGVGVVGGSFGSWRAWRTARELKILRPKWEIITVSQVTYELVNRSPRTVYGVTVEPTGERRVDWPEGLIVMPPNGQMRFMSSIGFTAKDGPLVVTWHHRRSLRDRAKSWTGYLPPDH